MTFSIQSKSETEFFAWKFAETTSQAVSKIGLFYVVAIFIYDFIRFSREDRPFFIPCIIVSCFAYILNQTINSKARPSFQRHERLNKIIHQLTPEVLKKIESNYKETFVRNKRTLHYQYLSGNMPVQIEKSKESRTTKYKIIFSKVVKNSDFLNPWRGITFFIIVPVELTQREVTKLVFEKINELAAILICLPLLDLPRFQKKYPAKLFPVENMEKQVSPVSVKKNYYTSTPLQ